MRETKTIELNSPIEHHNKTISSVLLKEPTAGQLNKFGEPRVYVRTNVEGGYWVEQPNVIAAYLDACLDHQDGSALVSLMSLSDGMQIKDALLGFFLDAAETNTKRLLASLSSK